MDDPVSPSPFRFTWRLPLALLLVAVAIGLMVSWMLPTGRAWWDSADQATFLWLNGTLSQDPTDFWNHFWALANVRWSDLLTGAIMAALLCIPGAVFPRGQIIRGFIAFVLLLILMLGIREGVDGFVNWQDLNRPGPTLVLDDTVKLSELYPDLDAKDRAARSFPGDHASVLFLWMGFCLALSRNAWSVLIVILALAFQLPRLVGGAHWLSDDLVGGLAIAGLGLAAGLCTPLLNRPLDALDRFFSGLWDRWIAPLVNPWAHPG